MYVRHCSRLFALLLCVAATSGCSSVSYYWQAINGHFDIVEREHSIKDLLQQKQLDPQLRRKLELVRTARRFASAELALPANDSYTRYADLKRGFVTWNVVVTPEFSVKPRQWCYLFAGCFNYRGYFHQDDAKAFARTMKTRGEDVAIGGAWAYSTLGWFADPVLNTMLQHDDSELIGTLFHELGHQTVYVDDDSSFNESFANTVEQVGLQRWYQHIGKPDEFTAYMHRQQARNDVIRMLEQTRDKLHKVYADTGDVDRKRQQKRVLFAALKHEYQVWRKQHPYDGFDNWMHQQLNNANLAMIATYSDDIPAFKHMLAASHGDLPAFYREARRVGELAPAQRAAVLARYAALH